MRKPLTEAEAEMRFRLLKQQLTLTILEEEYFIKKFGRGGLEEIRNTILDEINYLRKKHNISW